MKNITILFIGLLVAGLSNNLISILSGARDISIANRHPYKKIIDGKTNKLVVNQKVIIVKTNNFYEFLFLSNTAKSLITVITELLMCTVTGILLFSPESIRIKIFKSHFVQYLVVFFFCSEIISWFVTIGFINNAGNGLANYTYHFSYGAYFVPLLVLIFTIQTLRKFKQDYDYLYAT